MASPSNFTADLTLDEEAVQSAIRDVLQRILNSRDHINEIQNVNLQSNPEMVTIIAKIHDMLVKLDQIAFKLREFLNVQLIPSLIEKYLYSSPINPNMILNEIENLKATLESFLPKLSDLQTASNSTFFLLVQMSIEGIEIPSFEEFISAQTDFSLSNIMLSSMTNSQDTNSTNTKLVNELVMRLVHAFGKHYAWCKHFEVPLTSVGCLVTQLHLSFFEEYKKYFEEKKDAYDKIATLTQKLDESQIRVHLSRIERYISQAADNNQGFAMKLSNKIWESYCLVKQSIMSCRTQYPNANALDIIQELMQLPQCAGLVHPIVSLLGCSLENGWRIILDIFSQIHSTS